MGVPEVRRTFLFTDIERSTQLWERHPAEAGGAIAEHDALLRAAMEAHGGTVFKTVGDAFHVAFPAAPAALAAALAAQLALLSRDWGATGPLRVRMSLHSGVAEARGGDYFGPTLNRAARILGLGHGGQVLVSAAAAEELAGRLPERARLLDLGRHALRDLGDGEQVHQLLHPGLPSEFAPLRSLESHPNNLPLSPTSFVGREEDLQEIARLFPPARLLTLVGMGGCGKTRLGLQIATERLGRYRDGSWLVELAPLRDPDLVTRAVAGALGVKPEPDRRLEETLCDYLRGKRTLLLLDNCEHLVEAAAGLAGALLARCPEVHLLATSREPLRVPGETVWPVAPLPLPGHGVATLRDLEAFDATRLFLERARAAAPRAGLGDDDASLVGDICRRLDGIPLAIELAAARTRHLDLRDLHRGLDDRFRLLDRGDRLTDPRHRTLRAAIDWSYELLAPAERALLGRLSVFAGGFPAEFADRICGVRADAGLAQLVDQSLLTVADGQYALLESVRAYAAQKLDEAGEEEDLRRRHARLFAEFVHENGGHENLSSIEAALDDVRAALAWMREDPELRGTGLRTAAALWPFCWLRGYMPEGRRWLAAFLDAAGDDVGPEALAAAHYAAGVLAKELGDYAQAKEHYRRNLALDRDDGRRAGTLYALGHVLRIEGDYAGARRLYEESLSLCERAGHLRTMAGTLTGLGTTCDLEGDLEGARGHFLRALELSRQVDDRVGEGIALCNLGPVQHKLGDVRDARRTLRRSLRIAREYGDEQGVAQVLESLGRIATDEGHRRRARVLLVEALRRFEKAGSGPCIVSALAALADLASAGGDHDRAGRLRETVEASRARMGMHRGDDDGPDPHPNAMSLEEAVAYALR